MESHPVPQNVTTFEFHLVGDMTLKQFTYLASGLATAYITYVFIFPMSALVAIPIILVSAGLGVAFAFIPIQDRPLDHWAKAFFRAVFSPTQASWVVANKSGKITPKDPQYASRLQIYLSSLNQPAAISSQQSVSNSQIGNSDQKIAQSTLPTPSTVPTAPAPEEKPKHHGFSWPGFLHHEDQPSDTTPSTVNPSTPLPSPTPQQITNSYQPTPKVLSTEQLGTTVELAKQAQLVQLKIVGAERQLKYLQSAASTGVDPSKYSEELQKVFDTLQLLITNAQEISQKISETNGQNATPKPAVRATAPTVRIVETPKLKPTLPKLTSFPNVINGIVTDSASNYIEAAVVVIHNNEGLPVRALKTNKLGQFTGATPLPAGVYTVTIEKDGLDFDTLQVTLNDQILAPLEISPKRGGV
jgi:hypothetical protein